MDTDGRGLRLGGLLLTLVAAIAWYVAPSAVSWQPLVLALIPWLFRIRAGQLPFHRTPFDLLLLVFLLTAAAGVWAAYDREAAWSKFWIILAAILLYYALSGLARTEIPFAAGMFGVLAFLIATYFLLTHDWETWPADIGALTRIGRRWMSLRPTISLPPVHPNIVGGIIAVLFPPLIAVTLHLRRRRLTTWLWLAVVLCAFVLIALLLTSSRAAWLALSVALGIWFLWWMSQLLALRVQLDRKIIFIATLAGLAGIALWRVLSLPEGASAMIATLPGPDSTTTRLELWRQSWRLADDFPFTGGGLAAFAGLYSSYIRVIPFFLFSYSHNFYLDVLLEQGGLGLLSLVGVILGSVWLLVAHAVPRSRATSGENLASLNQPADLQWFRWAVLASLITMLLHGLVDDALYGNLGTPLLFSLPGVAVALSTTPDSVVQAPGIPGVSVRWAIFAAIFLGVAGAVYVNRKGILGSWYANLGAVTMARTELAAWPTNAWDDGRNAAALAPASAMFQQSLSLDPENRTAHHRSGLVAMLRREYAEAVVHLEAAHKADVGHRGIAKSLGYSYVWAGDLEKASGLLAEIPEARDEIDVYTWWWGAQGRDDLAGQARRMIVWLDDAATDSGS